MENQKISEGKMENVAGGCDKVSMDSIRIVTSKPDPENADDCLYLSEEEYNLLNKKGFIHSGGKLYTDHLSSAIDILSKYNEQKNGTDAKKI